MKIVKKKFILSLLVAGIIMLLPLVPASAAVPNLSGSNYIRAYSLSSNKNINVYTTSSLTTRGTASPKKAYNAAVYTVDEMYIYSIGSISSYISYPTNAGRKYGYVATSAITSNNYSQESKTSSAKITTYKRAGGDVYGSISKGDNVYTVAQSGNYTQVVYPVGTNYKMGWITTSNYNKYINADKGNNPQGFLDSAVCKSDNTITVEGWAFDKDNTNVNLRIDVYIGGSSSSGAPKYGITANSCRRDVNNAFPGVGDYHGFAATITTGKTGLQPIYVYAVNIGSGSDVLIGQTAVNITGSQYTDNLLSSNGITYASYTGVNFTNVGLSSERVAALQKAVKLATIQWTSPVTFRTWQSVSGGYNIATATDGTSSRYFVAGKTYQGIPYSMADHSYDDEKWDSLVKKGFTSNYMTTSYKGRKATTAHGIDCSYLTYLCFQAAGTGINIQYQDTATMLTSSYYTKKRNRLSDIKGGDILLKNGHVMMYVGKSGNNYAVIEANADDSRVCYNIYTASDLSSYGVYNFKGFSD